MMAETLVYAAILALLVANIVVVIVAIVWLNRLVQRIDHRTPVPMIQDPRLRR